MTIKAIYRHSLIAALAVMVMACTAAAGPSAPASTPSVQAPSARRAPRRLSHRLVDLDDHRGRPSDRPA